MLGKKIKELRIKNNLSQEQLAKIISVGRNSISRYENSKRYPSSDTIIAICKALNTDPNELLEYERSNKT